MSYTQKTWVSQETITADALNNMEEGIDAMHASVPPGDAASANSVAIVSTATASGTNSIAIGTNTATTVSNSIAIGANVHVGDAHHSIAIGRSANITADTDISTYCNGAIAIGAATLATTIHSVAIGYNAYAQGGNRAVAIGPDAKAYGAGSVAAGFNCGTNGSYSVALGSGAAAGCNIATALGYGTTASAMCSTAVGRSATASGNYSTALGGVSSASGLQSTAVGFNASCANDNGLQLGSSSSLSSLTSRVSLTVTSDIRDKADVTEIDDGATEFLNSVRAIRYVFNGRELYIDEDSLTDEDREKLARYGMCAYDTESWAAGTKKGSRIRVGVSAQEVQEALESVYGDSSYGNLVNDNLYDLDPDEIPDDVESRLAVNYDGFIPFIIKGFQELTARIEALEASGDEQVS